jgi:hypothetical protein
MRRLGLLTALILLTVFVPPARAAMPPVAPSLKIGCYDDDRPIGKGSAKIWVFPDQLAVTNPCTYWVKFTWGWDPSDPYRQHEIFVAPGKKFNWDAAHALGGLKFPLEHWDATLLKGKYVCRYPFYTYAYAKRVYAYNDARPVPKCVERNGSWLAP